MSLFEKYRKDYQSLWAAVQSLAPKIGCYASKLIEWAIRAEVDIGIMVQLSTVARIYNDVPLGDAEERDYRQFAALATESVLL